MSEQSRGRRRGGADDHPSVTLSNGFRAVVEADRHQPGAFTLVVDGTPQSHVALDDPRYLSFEYVRRIGHGIDLVAPEGAPITAVHLGGGAFTLPRYIAATRPSSRQQVVELESDLVDFVREQLPLPREAQIRIRHGDARDVLAKLPPGLKGTVDVVVVDVFSGARTPAHVTSMEFYALVSGLLSAQGIVAANVADGAGLAFARSQAATLSAVFTHVALVVDPQVLKSRRFGNVVMFASASPLPFDRLPRLVASDPTPAKVIDGAELRAFIASAPVVTDQTAIASPPPARSIFQVKPGASE
ncbi:fused MFS/spermidine synthase [Subtercola sp. PAMC28395]|uniref:spermidine synthase n=1 Tax=Subtercola sp. PAMC28395 TaxID=2846775 RepID=UPI001C0AF721|nr:fused MFS/spermidine synthase [Subtercola sp. PAMC28395]QWT24073.1 fused MFS/spermidine synthase [Subtercola sp. PAMC28395]